MLFVTHMNQITISFDIDWTNFVLIYLNRLCFTFDFSCEKNEAFNGN